jgi:SulP family sulfate permease
MVHALLLLVVVMVAAPLAARIPHAVLAGILVKVGYDIVDWTYVLRAYRGPRWDLLLMVVVLGLTVFVDLIAAVAAGVVLAALGFVKQLADLQVAALEAEPQALAQEERQLLAAADNRVLLFNFADGPLSFGAAADLGHHVRERARDGIAAIVLDLTRVPFLDLSAAMAVRTIVSDALAAGRHIHLAGANAAVNDVLSALDIGRVGERGGQWPSRLEALRAAVASLNSAPSAHPPA